MLMRAIRRTTIVSLVLAVVISCLYWFAPWWMPVDHLKRPTDSFLLTHWRLIDFVPSLFAQLLPASWRSGFHRYFRDDGTYCFPGPFWRESMRYLLAAIPGYFLAFTSIALLLRLAQAPWRMLRRPSPLTADRCRSGDAVNREDSHRRDYAVRGQSPPSE